jgi:hypothetical protein
MSYYCSLAEARRELATQKTSADEDRKLLERIWQASRRIDLELGSPDYPVFAPYSGSWPLLVTSEHINSSENTIALEVPFQSITSVDLSGTALAIGTDIAYYPDAVAPYRKLRMKSSACYTWYNRVCLDACADPLTLTVTGVRGYRRRGGSAWLKVDDLALALTSSATSIQVADIDGADPRGYSPRLSPGHLIRIVTGGATEYMNILPVVDTSANTAGLERGVNGTEAIAHNLNDDVEVWQVEDNIRRVTARQAAALYARIGSYEEKTITDIGLISYPKDLLTELRGVLQGYAYL